MKYMLRHHSLLGLPYLAVAFRSVHFTVHQGDTVLLVLSAYQLRYSSGGELRDNATALY